MAEFPALPLFTDALLADTEHLTNEEFGAYIRMLIIIWRNAECRIPADQDWHMRRLRVNESEYNRLYKPLIAEFLQSTGNWITQKRLKREFDYLRETRGKQSVNAKKRWANKKTASGGTATDPTPPQAPAGPVDFKKVIFDEGLRWISEQAKRPPNTMRSLLAKWCKLYGDAQVAAVIVKAQGFSPVEPISFCEKMLKEGLHANNRPGARESESAKFKRALVEGTLADEAAERPGGAAPGSNTSGLLL